MKFLTIIDSFKGSLGTKEINDIVANQINRKGHLAVSFPISDGGEGLVDMISNHIDGKLLYFTVEDAWGNELNASVFRSENMNNSYSYWIDSSQVIGIHTMSKLNLDISKSSSYALGMLLKEILKKCRLEDKVILGLGGSGTVDGGLGLLQAFNVKIFNDKNQEIVYTTNPLFSVYSIVFPDNFPFAWFNSIDILADVKNKYAFENNGIKVYSKQKGATEEQISQLEYQTASILEIMDCKQLNIACTGAAGGISGMLYFLGANLYHGTSYINNILNLEARIKWADVVITGEGFVDAQTDQGKLVYNIAKMSHQYNKKVIVISGQYAENIGKLGNLINGIFSIQREIVDLDTALKQKYVEKNLHMLVESILGIIDIAKE